MPPDPAPIEPVPDEPTAGTVATDPVATMWAADEASRGLGIELVSAEPGRCTTRLRLEDRHLNGLGVCHGGFLLTLADTAMAFASNASGVQAFATGIEIDFLAPGRLGRTVTAVATQTASVGRNGIFDVVLTDDEGVVLAVTRGRTRQVPGGLR